MLTTEIPYLDGEFSVEEDEPSTLQELASLVGELEVIRRFVRHYRYHYKYPRVYEAVSRKIAGFPRRAGPNAGPFEDETEVQHIQRYLREYPTMHARVEQLFREIAPTIPLVPQGLHGTKSKIPQSAMDAATGFFAKGQERVEQVAEHIKDTLINCDIERDAEGHITIEGLARGIHALNKQLQQQAKEKAKVILS